MARDPSDAFQDAVTFGQFAGMVNTSTPERMTPEELQKALNVDIDDRNQARRRRGYALAAAGDFHSLWESEGTTLVVKDGTLGYLRPDFSHSSLVAGVGATKLSYTRVADIVYISGEGVAKKLDLNTDVVSDWGAADAGGEWVSPVVNPTNTLGQVWGTQWTNPPYATALVAFQGRIWLANDNVLWATEYFLFDKVDATKNFIQFEADITTLGEVSDGLYVGTRRGTYYLTGSLGQMNMRQVNEFECLPGSLVQVNAEMVRPERNESRMAVMYMTDHGVCIGLDGGTSYNITETRMIFPDAHTATAMFRQQDGINQYVAVTDSGGTPASKARIGDYVDAEIRRFSA